MGMTAARLRERRALERKGAPSPTPPLTEAQRFANARAELAKLRQTLLERDALIAELKQQLEQLTQPPAPPTQEQQPPPGRGTEKRRGRP